MSLRSSEAAKRRRSEGGEGRRGFRQEAPSPHPRNPVGGGGVLRWNLRTPQPLNTSPEAGGPVFAPYSRSYRRGPLPIYGGCIGLLTSTITKTLPNRYTRNVGGNPAQPSPTKGQPTQPPTTSPGKKSEGGQYDDESAAVYKPRVDDAAGLWAGPGGWGVSRPPLPHYGHSQAPR